MSEVKWGLYCHSARVEKVSPSLALDLDTGENLHSRSRILPESLGLAMVKRGLDSREPDPKTHKCWISIQLGKVRLQQ